MKEKMSDQLVEEMDEKDQFVYQILFLEDNPDDVELIENE